MAELTDSYCERCGARYVFSPSTPKGFSLKRATVLAKGLRNFVLTDGQSMADALALARLEEGHEDSSRMTEAFHKTFNLCMTCRQYACDRCWDPVLGVCLSCAPTADRDRVNVPGLARVPPPANPQVAESDSEWAFLRDDFSSDAGPEPDPPVPFNAPIRFGDASPEDPVAPQAPPDWPLTDLPQAEPALQAGLDPGPPVVQRASYKRADPLTTSLWPITDEISPEMALTPEELMLVESQLGQPLKPAGADQAQPETYESDASQARAETSALMPSSDVGAALPEWDGATWSAPAPQVLTPDAPAIPNPTPALQPFTSIRGHLEGTAEFAVEAGPEFGHQVDSTAIPQAEPPRRTEPEDEPAFRVELPPQPVGAGHVLRMPIASPALPPLAAATPEPQPRERLPLMARLFGRHEAPVELAPGSAGLDADPEPAVGAAWPVATPWMDRPLENHGWLGAVDGPAEEAKTQPGAGESGPDRLDAQPPAAEQSAPERDMPSPINVEPAWAESGHTEAGIDGLRPEAAGSPTPGPAENEQMRAEPEPIGPQATQAGIDPRTAAAMRLSAVGADAATSDSDVASADVPPEEYSFWTDATAGRDDEEEQPDEPFWLVEPGTLIPSEPSPVAAPAPPAPASPSPAVPAVAASPGGAPTGPIPPLPAPIHARPVQPQPAVRPPVYAAPIATAARLEATAGPAAWPDADREVADAAARRSAETPDEARTGQRPPAVPAPQTPNERVAADSMPAVPWPPIGPNWTAPEKPQRAWPGPEAAPLPAILAAQQAGTPTVAEMWAQSAEEVLNRGSVRTCQRCALPVSTHARFCRRCGTKQA